MVFQPRSGVLAKRTALRYAGAYAPEFSCHVRAVGTGQGEGGFWTVTLFREEDEARQGPALRLEIRSRIFPAEVTEATWWAAEATGRPEDELPVPGY